MIIKPNWDIFKAKIIKDMKKKLLKFDPLFDSFQNSSSGKFILEKILFRKKGFYSILSTFGLILVAQLSAYNNIVQWADKIDEQVKNAEGWSYLSWLFLSFIVPEGNLTLIIVLIIIIIGVWIIRLRELNQEKSIEETLIKPLQEKVKNILFQIKTVIPFNGKKIELNRNDEIKSIKENLTDKQVIVLSGEGGVGKTAIIKQLFEEKHEKDIFYVIKAIEFQDKNVLYRHNIQEFIDAHDNFDNKIFVIDSAEKLIDIENTEFFKEFLSVLIQHSWKVILTTRHSYLDDLNYEFMENYQIKPYAIEIKKLSLEKLQELSTEFGFKVPDDEKLKKLILNPFYLNEFLQTCDENAKYNYLDFKNKLWNKVIKKSNPNREQCFLYLALQRANSGQFFVSIDCQDNSLKELLQDGILGYEKYGYFITHDIYEEWALEYIIDKEFLSRNDNHSFIYKIGNSLPVRRSFRHWMSEKLLLGSDDIKLFIGDMVDNKDIESFWKDEVLISVLLSDYANTFFINFEKELLANDFELLKRVSFLLRLACKEVDNSYFERVGIKNLEPIDLMSVFNKPKGKGWEIFIKYVYSHNDLFKLQDIVWILPILFETMNKIQYSEIERQASLIALNFYEMTTEERYYYDNEQIKKLCTIIINGSTHIVNELKLILDEVLKKQWKYNSDKYNDLSKLILSGLWGIQVLNVMPKYVMELANLFWRYTPKEPIESPFGIRDDDSFHDRLERVYGIEKYGLDYSTASAYQTPIYNLLKADFKSTIDFILKFVNESIEIYSKSEYADYLLKVKVNINEKCVAEQYHDVNLWGMYRGTNSSPELLQSIHMALEKYLLEIAKDLDDKTLKKLLIYLLQNSTSSSISAVVSSIVLAYPDKTFDVVKILFQTKEFITYDLTRNISDSYSFNSFNLGLPIDAEQQIFDAERKESSKLEHRKKSLENLFLFYQAFRSDGVSEKEAAKKQTSLWNILDNYYEKLDTKDDKSWEMALARMDRRKMDIQLEQQENEYTISFNPELSNELKNYSEKAQTEHKENNRYLSLVLWSGYKLDSDDECKQYQEYENNPVLVFKQLQEVIKESQNKENILYIHIPINVSLVLLGDYENKLSQEERIFCKNILLNAIKDYSGTHENEQIISFLPNLMRLFPEDRNNIKKLLFKLLCSGYNLSNAWDNFDDANSLLIGYLILKPKYLLVWNQKREEAWRLPRYVGFDLEKIYVDFMEENKEIVDSIINSTISIKEIKDYSTMDNEVLIQAFNFLPTKLVYDGHKNIAQNIIYNVISRLLIDKKDIEFSKRNKFIKKFASILLSSSKEEIDNYLKVFIDNFDGSEVIAEFFVELILLEDQILGYDNFWYIWELFRESLINLCKNGDEYWNIDKIIKAYFLATRTHGFILRSESKEWSSFKDRDVKFLKSISSDIAHCPSVLYSISVLLTSIGSKYEALGIEWIATMLHNNKQLLTKKLESDTVFNIEIFIRKCILKNITNIRKNKKIKNDILEILNFLVKQGSAIGYMLRERIL